MASHQQRNITRPLNSMNTRSRLSKLTLHSQQQQQQNMGSRSGQINFQSSSSSSSSNALSKSSGMQQQQHSFKSPQSIANQQSLLPTHQHQKQHQQQQMQRATNVNRLNNFAHNASSSSSAAIATRNIPPRPLAANSNRPLHPQTAAATTAAVATVSGPLSRPTASAVTLGPAPASGSSGTFAKPSSANPTLLRTNRSSRSTPSAISRPQSYFSYSQSPRKNALSFSSSSSSAASAGSLSSGKNQLKTNVHGFSSRVSGNQNLRNAKTLGHAPPNSAHRAQKSMIRHQINSLNRIPVHSNDNNNSIGLNSGLSFSSSTTTTSSTDTLAPFTGNSSRLSPMSHSSDSDSPDLSALTTSRGASSAATTNLSEVRRPYMKSTGNTSRLNEVIFDGNSDASSNVFKKDFTSSNDPVFLRSVIQELQIKGSNLDREKMNLDRRVKYFEHRAVQQQKSIVELTNEKEALKTRVHIDPVVVDGLRQTIQKLEANLEQEQKENLDLSEENKLFRDQIEQLRREAQQPDDQIQHAQLQSQTARVNSSLLSIFEDWSPSQLDFLLKSNAMNTLSQQQQQQLISSLSLQENLQRQDSTNLQCNDDGDVTDIRPAKRSRIEENEARVMTSHVPVPGSSQQVNDDIAPIRNDIRRYNQEQMPNAVLFVRKKTKADIIRLLFEQESTALLHIFSSTDTLDIDVPVHIRQQPGLSAISMDDPSDDNGNSNHIRLSWLLYHQFRETVIHGQTLAILLPLFKYIIFRTEVDSQLAGPVLSVFDALVRHSSSFRDAVKRDCEAVFGAGHNTFKEFWTNFEDDSHRSYQSTNSESTVDTGSIDFAAFEMERANSTRPNIEPIQTFGNHRSEHSLFRIYKKNQNANFKFHHSLPNILVKKTKEELEFDRRGLQQSSTMDELPDITEFNHVVDPRSMALRENTLESNVIIFDDFDPKCGINLSHWSHPSACRILSIDKDHLDTDLSRTSFPFYSRVISSNYTHSANVDNDGNDDDMTGTVAEQQSQIDGMFSVPAPRWIHGITEQLHEKTECLDLMSLVLWCFYRSAYSSHPERIQVGYSRYLESIRDLVWRCATSHCAPAFVFALSKSIFLPIVVRSDIALSVKQSLIEMLTPLLKYPGILQSLEEEKGTNMNMIDKIIAHVNFFKLHEKELPSEDTIAFVKCIFSMIHFITLHVDSGVQFLVHMLPFQNPCIETCAGVLTIFLHRHLEQLEDISNKELQDASISLMQDAIRLLVAIGRVVDLTSVCAYYIYELHSIFRHLRRRMIHKYRKERSHNVYPLVNMTYFEFDESLINLLYNSGVQDNSD